MPQEYDFFDNVSRTVKDDLVHNLKPGDALSFTGTEFSLFGYQELAQELDECSRVRFLYTSPTFTTSKTTKQAREFYVPRHDRETGISGSGLEIRLKNQMTQVASSRRCAKWISDTASFRSFTSDQVMPQGLIVESDGDTYIYQNLQGLTAPALGATPSSSQFNTISRFGAECAKPLLAKFNEAWSDDKATEDVSEAVLESIEDLYAENAPELVYHAALQHIFSEFLDSLDEDSMAKEGTGYKDSKIWSMLYDFQRHGANAIINKLETYNGCILADSVGLGKTFTALAVIKYYESRNRNVLVLCPKKLSDNWMTYRNNVKNNPIAQDRLRYDVLYHTDLNRTRGRSASGIDLSAINWGSYDLVVIDESHNFRNGDRTAVKSESGENRYTRLMNNVIKDGVKTKVLMLSATPVNNRFLDLENQLELAYGMGDKDWQSIMDLKNPVDVVLSQAQGAYNTWAQLPDEERTTTHLMDQLSPDFFKLLDQVTVARSRKQIVRYYDTSSIGPFPARKPPVSLRPDLSDAPNVGTFSQIAQGLRSLLLANYMPSHYLLPSRVDNYLEDGNLSLAGREKGIRNFMAINLLKRLESSVEAFRKTANKVRANIQQQLDLVSSFEKTGLTQGFAHAMTSFELDDDDATYQYLVGKADVNLADMDWRSWKADLSEDLSTLDRLIKLVEPVDPDHDLKLEALKKLLKDKVEHPFNEDNKKVLIFTASSDTARYLYENIAPWAIRELGLNSALVTGDDPGRCTLDDVPRDTQTVLACFSPLSKERDLLMPDLQGKDVSFLIGTDCISEGQNLQDCDCVVNYDIHWNPLAIIQRFGRVDRIGSKNETIQLVNFWPNIELDEYINLKSRVEDRMHLTVMTSTGDDDLLNENEKGDLEYRRRQMEQMQTQNIDLEDVAGSVTITDLGLDEFRSDLLAWVKTHGERRWLPTGIHAVVSGENPGIIFILKNINEGVNISKANRLHPFYLVYVAQDGTIINNQLQSRDTLTLLRQLCLGKNRSDPSLCRLFNKATKDGKDMRKPSALLEDAVASIIEKDRESVVDSFFSAGVSSLGQKTAEGLDDFELLDFVVVV